jgi:hypothetical protein
VRGNPGRSLCRSAAAAGVPSPRLLLQLFRPLARSLARPSPSRWSPPGVDPLQLLSPRRRVWWIWILPARLVFVSSRPAAHRSSRTGALPLKRAARNCFRQPSPFRLRLVPVRPLAPPSARRARRLFSRPVKRPKFGRRPESASNCSAPLRASASCSK